MFLKIETKQSGKKAMQKSENNYDDETVAGLEQNCTKCFENTHR